MKLNRSLMLVFATLLLAGCSANGNSANEATANRPTNGDEPTVAHDERQILTGVITDEGEGLYLFPKKPGRWILVEEDPNADCQGRKGLLKPDCEKMYFDVTDKTRVLREAGSDQDMEASAADLEKGQRVSADYTGYGVADSDPSQTDARTIVILESR